METDDEHMTGEWVEIEHGRETYEVRKTPGGSFRCPISKPQNCQSYLETKTGLKSHMTQSHFTDAKVSVECPHCGDEYRVSRSKIDHRTFCSPECRDKHYSGEDPRETVICQNPECGDEFDAYRSQNRKYCSRECYYEHQY